MRTSGSSFWNDDVPELFDPNSVGRPEQERLRLEIGPTFLPGQHQNGVTAAETYSTPDGRTVVLAYSSVHKLVDCLGGAQSWIAVDAAVSPARLQLMCGADLIIWDSPVPESLQVAEEHHD